MSGRRSPPAKRSQRAHSPTNSQGEYRLRFAEGFATTSPNPIQAAHFHAASEGYFIKSSTRPLQTVMARQLPDEKDRFGHAPEEISLMNQPFRLDITMTRPAVSARR